MLKRQYTPLPDKVLQGLINRLGSDDFAIRDKADRDLREKATEADWDPLVKAVKEYQDEEPEIWDRVRKVVAMIDARQAPDVRAARLVWVIGRAFKLMRANPDAQKIYLKASDILGFVATKRFGLLKIDAHNMYNNLQALN